MECLVVGVIVLTVFSLLAGVGTNATLNRSGGFQELAKRYKGIFVGGGLLGQPQVKIRYGESLAVIRPTKYRGMRFIQVRLGWPDSRIALEILPVAQLRQASFRRASELTLGDPQFDQQFLVKATDPAEAKLLLSEGVRWQAGRLAFAFDRGDLSIVWKGGGLIVEKRLSSRKAADLEQLVRMVFELYDQAMLTRCVGIEFVDAMEAVIVEEPICQVCSEAITVDMVFCRRCLTPHHHDCWLYTGCCSTYGCQETEYAVPTLAQHAGPVEEDSNVSQGQADADSGEKPKPR